MTTSHNEAFSRILIDNALKASGWNLLDPQQVRFEHSVANGRADYLLIDNLGRVLCVLEAKREDLDPYDAKEQARGYAENLKAPFLIIVQWPGALVLELRTRRPARRLPH